MIALKSWFKVGLINNYSPRYSLTPYKVEESFKRTEANYVSKCTTFCPTVTSFADNDLTSLNLIGIPGGPTDFRLANLLVAHGIDAPQMPAFYSALEAARDAKGDNLNLNDVYNVTNSISTSDTLPAFQAVGLNP